VAAVVVDPYSSGKYLLLDLEKRGVPIVAVRSTTQMSSQFLRSHEANSKFFSEFLEFDEMEEGLPQLVEAVRALPYNIVGVFAGSEPGVELANRLSGAIGLVTTNPLELLEARKDKAEMQEALRRCGVPAAEQFKSGDLDQLLVWARDRGQWPLVAKPTGGAGSEGVFLCKTEDDITNAHHEIIGNLSATGAFNSELALQEFLEGDEYIVDTVSFEGKHMCVAMWVYNKKKGLPWNPHAIMMEQSMLLAPNGEKQDKLIEYTLQVLDAVGLEYGPCHTEIMFTQRGPILVEVNARMHGLQGPRLIELCTGTSKATYTADAIIGQGRLFNERYRPSSDERFLYPVVKQCVGLSLISSVEGYLTSSIKAGIAIMELPSVIEILPSVQEGGYLLQTKDLPTLAGTVLMVHESMDQINADIQQIRDAEADLTLYQVSATPLQAKLI